MELSLEEWNFSSTFTELHVHGDERWPTEVTSDTYFRSLRSRRLRTVPAITRGFVFQLNTHPLGVVASRKGGRVAIKLLLRPMAAENLLETSFEALIAYGVDDGIQTAVEQRHRQYGVVYGCADPERPFAEHLRYGNRSVRQPRDHKRPDDEQDRLERSLLLDVRRGRVRVRSNRVLFDDPHVVSGHSEDPHVAVDHPDSGQEEREQGQAQHVHSVAQTLRSPVWPARTGCGIVRNFAPAH